MASIYERRDNGDGTYSQNTAITDSDAILPTSIERHYTKLVQTHAAVSVLPSAWSGNSWLDTDGFNEIAVTFLNDAVTSSTISLEWSNDGTVKQGTETIGVAATGKERAFSVPTKAKWVKVVLYNGDSVAHTMSAWAYLKA